MKNLHSATQVILLSVAICLNSAFAATQEEIDAEEQMNQDFKRLVARKILLHEKITALDEDISLAHAKHDLLLPEYTRARNAYRSRIRLESVGENLGQLTLTSGRSYKNATIQSVQEVGISISHQEGIARIHYADLPASIRERFLFDSDEAANQLQLEKDNRENFQKLHQNLASRTETNPRSQQAKSRSSEKEPLKPVVERGDLTAKPVGYSKGTKYVEFSAITNCDAVVYVDGVERFRVSARKPTAQRIRVPNNYNARLVSATGKLLDSEGTLRKSGSSLDTQHQPLKRK